MIIALLPTYEDGDIQVIYTHPKHGPERFVDLHNRTAFAQCLEYVDKQLLGVVLLWLLSMLAAMLAAVLAAVLLLAMASLIATAMMALARWWQNVRNILAAGQVDVNSTLILLGSVRESQLLTQLLNARLNLLHMADGMIALADDDVQMGLALLLRGANPRAHNLLGLLDELAVQVNGVVRDPARGVVLAEYEFAGLPVVVVGFGRVLLCFDTEIVGAPAVAALICLLRLVRDLLALAHLVAG
jgi:hypothetical protein